MNTNLSYEGWSRGVLRIGFNFLIYLRNGEADDGPKLVLGNRAVWDTRFGTERCEAEAGALKLRQSVQSSYQGNGEVPSFAETRLSLLQIRSGCLQC